MRATFVLVGLLMVAVAACSAAESIMPAEFNAMTSDEVGCTVTFGDDSLYTVGPLGSGEVTEVEPNDYTTVRVARTASNVVVVADFYNSGTGGGAALSDIPSDGLIVAQGPFRDGGTPGYVVTCWRGDS